MAMQDSSTATGRIEADVSSIGLFAVALSIALTAIMAAFRTGLPTPVLAWFVGPAILAVTVLLPALWAGTNTENQRRRLPWIGPLALLTLLLACGLVAIGAFGIVALCAIALWVIYRALARLRSTADRPPQRLGWIGVLALAAGFATVLIAGNKYANFLADQLLLYGRTDGDIMFHGAIVGAFRYFGFPSTGIDGLHLLHYHVGLDAVASLIGRGTAFDSVLALIVLRAQILFPLTIFAAAWGARLLGHHLASQTEERGWLIPTAAAIVVVLMLQTSMIGNLVLNNDPVLFGGVILLLVAPTVISQMLDGCESGVPWLVALVAIPLLSAVKISDGYGFAALTGFWALRLLGPKRWEFWAIGAAIAVLFLPCYVAFTDSGAAGAVLFGTPFFVERGFAKGNYLLPLTSHALALLALAGLVLGRRGFVAFPRRFLIESLCFAIFVGVLPGLLLELPGGDAYFFLVFVAWLAVPVLTFLLAYLLESIRRAGWRSARLGIAIAVLALIAIGIENVLAVPRQFAIVVSQSALLHTGDRTFYADDSRKAWRADAARALDRYRVVALFRLPPPEPPGLGLAKTLSDLKTQLGAAAAAYIPPQSDYWGLVPDCDGRSLWPMAAAGVPLIDGYVPVQADCVQEFAVSGYHDVPPVRRALSDQEICDRAKRAGFSAVLVVPTLADRTQDRRLSCE